MFVKSVVVKCPGEYWDSERRKMMKCNEVFSSKKPIHKKIYCGKCRTTFTHPLRLRMAMQRLKLALLRVK